MSEEPPCESADGELLLKELVVWGSVDYLWLGQLPRYARLCGAVGAEQEHRDCLTVLRALLSRGLWVAGAHRGNGFKPWQGSTDDAIAQIESEWRGLVVPASLGDVCWFANTPAGDTYARDLRAAAFESKAEE